MHKTPVRGGAGFLDSRFCDRQVEPGNDQARVNGFCTDSKTNVAHLQCNKTLELISYHACGSLYVEVEQIFATSGLWMHSQDTEAASNVIAQGLLGELTIYGNGAQARRFGFVGDPVGVILPLMESPANFTGLIGGPVGAEGQPEVCTDGRDRLLPKDCMSRQWLSAYPRDVPAFDPRR